MPIYPGVTDSQKKVPPLPPAVASRSDSGSGRAFNNGATFLTFSPTIFDGKLPIIDYVVTAVSETNETVTQTITDLNPFVFTGLRSGVRYRYKIKARNAVSESADSDEQGPDTATTVPGRPTSLTAINLVNGGGISLNWIAPPNAGKAITSYTITPSVGAPIVTNSSSTSYSFSGVVGTTYNFTVAATNENGTGEDSTASGTVVPTAPVVVTTTQAPTGGGGPSGPTIGITSFAVSGVIDEAFQRGFATTSFSAFGYASYSLSGAGCSTGIINGTYNPNLGAGATCAAATSFCNQTVTVTAVVYSGSNGTGTTATATATFVLSGTGCPSIGGGTATTTTAAPVALPCSPGNGNCSTPTCAACDPNLSYTSEVADSSCLSGLRYRYTCWTGGSCPNTTTSGACVPPAVNPTAAPTAAPTTAAPVVTCSGPCLGTWSIVNGVCRCTATTSAPTAAPTTAAPTTVNNNCYCRDFRGRCLRIDQCVF